MCFLASKRPLNDDTTVTRRLEINTVAISFFVFVSSSSFRTILSVALFVLQVTVYGSRYKLQDAQYWPASASDYVNYPNGGGVLDPHLSSPPNFVYSASQGPWMDDQYDQSESPSSMNYLKYSHEREL